jgi:hypothetical protein
MKPDGITIGALAKSFNMRDRSCLHLRPYERAKPALALVWHQSS